MEGLTVMTAAGLADHAALEPADHFALDCGLGVAFGLEFVAVVDELEPGVQALGTPTQHEGLDVVAMPGIGLAPCPDHPKGELRHLDHAKDRPPRQGRRNDPRSDDRPATPRLMPGQSGFLKGHHCHVVPIIGEALGDFQHAVVAGEIVEDDVSDLHCGAA